MPHNAQRNASSVVAQTVVWLFVLTAAALSAHDIVTLFGRLGVPFPFSLLAPVFVDGVIWLGKLMRSHRLSVRTNRLGLKYLVIGGSASLVANWVAGDTRGWKLLGVLAVVGYVMGEIALDHIEPRPAPPAKAPVSDEVRARRSEAAQRAAATRRANQARAQRKPRAPRQARQLRQLELAWDMPDAPVSPAP